MEIGAKFLQNRHSASGEDIMSWLPKKTVVVPVDFSNSSAEALRTALEFVAERKDVHVLYVTLAPDFLLAAGGGPAHDREEELHLSKFVADQQATGVTQLVREGDPGLVIADYAAEVGAELIVMPSHGYHGLKRVLLGSVAERVLRHSACPILLLRRQD